MIGKADDDIWIQLPSTGVLLRSSLDALRAAHPRQAEPQMLWGELERYHWEEAVHRPTRFARDFYDMAHCTRQRLRRDT